VVARPSVHVARHSRTKLETDNDHRSLDRRSNTLETLATTELVFRHVLLIVYSGASSYGVVIALGATRQTDF